MKFFIGATVFEINPTSHAEDINCLVDHKFSFEMSEEDMNMPLSTVDLMIDEAATRIRDVARLIMMDKVMRFRSNQIEERIGLRK